METGKRTKVAVLSDVHIGDNSKTCWYQKIYHEPYLLAALDYIKQKADEIDEVVLLGDFFDFWTYPCSIQPPSFSKIVQENPNVLGPNGALTQLASLMPDRIVYINGNHDMNIKQEEIGQLGRIRYIDNPRHVKTDQNRRILFTHGSEYTIFNALDADTPLSPLPVGHFVTRAISDYLQRTLPEGKTAADIKDNGAPGNWLVFLKKIIGALFGGFSVTEILLNYIIEVTGISDDTSVILQNGQSVTFKKVKEYYYNLASRWIQKFGGGQVGMNAAYNSINADFSGDYIAWYAQRDSLQSYIDTDLAVLGHTHKHKVGLKQAMIGYMNSGFMCSPFIEGQFQYPVTFSEIDLLSDTLSMLSVVKKRDKLEIADITAQSPAETLVYSTNDYSCYVSILNYTGFSMDRIGIDSKSGYYVVPPPESVRYYARARFWIESYPLTGEETEGKASYRCYNQYINYAYGCSGGSHFVNKCNPVPYLNKVDGGFWYREKQSRGFPFFVNFCYGAIIILAANNKKLVTSKNGKLSASMAGGAITPSERFQVVDSGFRNKLGLILLENNKFVCADRESGEHAPLIANKDLFSDTVVFEIVFIEKTQIALRSIKTGKYVCADHALGEDRPLAANKDSVGPSETFTMYPHFFNKKKSGQMYIPEPEEKKKSP